MIPSFKIFGYEDDFVEYLESLSQQIEDYHINKNKYKEFYENNRN